MKKVLFLILMLSACTNQRTNGIYQSGNGWDIVENGKTYQYRCEPDGLYLYIDFDGSNSYTIDFRHNDNEITFTHIDFLCKNKDGKYIYVSNYHDINIQFYNLNEIGFNIDDGCKVIHEYKPNKMCFSLLEKYTSR